MQEQYENLISILTKQGMLSEDMAEKIMAPVAPRPASPAMKVTKKDILGKSLREFNEAHSLQYAGAVITPIESGFRVQFKDLTIECGKSEFRITTKSGDSVNYTRETLDYVSGDETRTCRLIRDRINMTINDDTNSMIVNSDLTMQIGSVYSVRLSAVNAVNATMDVELRNHKKNKCILKKSGARVDIYLDKKMLINSDGVFE